MCISVSVRLCVQPHIAWFMAAQGWPPLWRWHRSNRKSKTACLQRTPPVQLEFELNHQQQIRTNYLDEATDSFMWTWAGFTTVFITALLVPSLCGVTQYNLVATFSSENNVLKSGWLLMFGSLCSIRLFKIAAKYYIVPICWQEFSKAKLMLFQIYNKYWTMANMNNV